MSSDTRSIAVWTASLAGAVVLLGSIAYAISHTLSTFVLAFVLAYLVDPLVVIMERRGLGRMKAILALYAVLGLVTVFASLVVVPFVGIKWQQFLADLPVYLQKARDLVGGWKSHYLPMTTASGWGWLFDTVSAQAETTAETVCSGAYAAAASVVFNAVNFILAPILVFFMLVYKERAAEGILAAVPPSRRQMLARLGREINASIGGYIRGQLVVSLIVAILSIIALFVLDVDYPVLSGIFAGLASILPFIGVIIATIPPLLLAYIKFQSLMAIVQVAGAFAVIYFIEGYIIKPLVFRRAMEMNPLTTIIAVMACGEIMGFWGILLAIPLAATFRIVVEHARRGDFREESI